MLSNDDGFPNFRAIFVLIAIDITRKTLMRKVLQDNEGIDSDSANQGMVESTASESPKSDKTDGKDKADIQPRK